MSHTNKVNQDLEAHAKIFFAILAGVLHEQE
jgi:hypothetical protein